MAKFTRRDYNNLLELKEKLGTWQKVYEETGIPGRTARRIRAKFREGADQVEVRRNRQYENKIKNNIQRIKKTPKEQLKTTGVANRYIPKKTREKYFDKPGIPSLSKDDYAYYDREKEVYRAGEYSNYPTGATIDKTTYRRIRGQASRQIRKMNKAKQFLYQGYSRKESYNLANAWMEEYQETQNIINDIIYQDSKGRWHWGEQGARLYGKKKGGFVSKKMVKDIKELILEGSDDIQDYIDKVFDLEPSP